MKKLLIAIVFALPICLFSQAPNSREFEMKEGDTTYIMKKYWLVLLERGGEASNFTKEQLQELQAGHMKNINAMAEAGKLIIAGPMGDDSPLRGIFIFDVETQAEVEELLKNDPSIQAGRLTAQIHPWWAAKGSVLK